MILEAIGQGNWSRRLRIIIGLIAKSLGGRRARAWLAVAGIATCTLLVIVLAAAFRSVRTAMSNYAGQRNIDLWLAPPGVDNLIRGSFSSYIPLTSVDSILAIPGVFAAQPISKAFLVVRTTGSTQRRLTLLSIGYRIPNGLGGPPAFALGHAPNGRDHVALDRAAAFRLGVTVGDSIIIGPQKAAVVGLTTGTNILATQFVFTDFKATALGAGNPNQASFILIKLVPGSKISDVIKIINDSMAEFDVYTREDFVDSNEREITAGFVPLLALVAILGFGAAALLVGLLVLNVIGERRSDISVLFALGAKPRLVANGVLSYAAFLLMLGAAIGILLAYGLEAALAIAIPTIPLSISVIEVIVFACLFILFGMGAGLVPVIRLKRIDPLEAFRP